MAFKGEIDGVGIETILRLCAVEYLGGRLELRSKDGISALLLDKGRVVAVEGPGEVVTLSHLLVEAGIISNDDIEPVFEEVKKNGARMTLGESLVNRGAVKKDILVRVLAEQAIDVLFDALTWSEGQFFLDTQSVVEPCDAGIPLPLGELVSRSLTLREQWESLVERLPANDACLIVSERAAQEGHSVEISPSEWKILSFLGDGRTMTEIKRRFRLSLPTLYTEIAEMLDKGLIEAADEDIQRRREAESLKRQYVVTSDEELPEEVLALYEELTNRLERVNEDEQGKTQASSVK